tara:strand:- start:375 stop:2063 length:1689 start_codon:yes stop_codon:yes gene_type:complete
LFSLKRSHILSFAKDTIITFAISFFIFLIFVRSDFFTFGPWPYGHAGDAVENVRTAFFSSWGYLPLKDIAINHMPGVPELLFLGSKFGRFFPREYFQDSVILHKHGSYAASICLQVALSYSSLRFFFNRNFSALLAFLLVFYTSFLYHFLPLSESYIPYFMMLWGAIYLNKKEKNKNNFLNFRTFNLTSILIIILWIGLTSPFSVFLLGILIISEIDLKEKNRSILKNIISVAIPCIISIIFFQLRYGLIYIYKWNILANTSRIDPITLLKNLKEQFNQNFHSNIFDNQIIPILIFFTSVIIFLYFRKIIISKNNNFDLNKQKVFLLKQIFLKKIIFFSTVIFICQILDSWRFAGGDYGNSQIYKTEASWGLLIPLISYLIISLNKLPELLNSKNYLSEILDIKFSKNRLIVNPLIFIFISYIVSITLVSDILLAPKYLISDQIVEKPKLEGIPNLLPKKQFLKGSRKCGVIDTWDPEAWMHFDIQPCLGVFINSVPGMADKNPFNLDMLNLIKSNQLVIRGIPEINKKDVWPVYQRQFAEYITCEKIDHALGMICKSETTN